MGIIVNDTYTDKRGFTATQTYASFSRDIRFVKVNRTTRTEISEADASGNENAIKEPHYAQSVVSPGPLYRYYLESTSEKYNVQGELIHYKDKDARLTNKIQLTSHLVSIYIDLNELPNIYTKLYEKVKSDKTLFPYNDLTDDL